MVESTIYGLFRLKVFMTRIEHSGAMHGPLFDRGTVIREARTLALRRDLHFSIHLE